MRYIQYTILDGDGEKVTVRTAFSEAAARIAKAQSINGDYVVDNEPDVDSPIYALRKSMDSHSGLLRKIAKAVGIPLGGE